MNNHEVLIKPVPAVVWCYVFALLAPELLLQLSENGLLNVTSSEGWRITAYERFSVRDDLLDFYRARGEIGWSQSYRLFSYVFLHQGFLDAIVSASILLAVGKFVAERIRIYEFLIFALLVPASSVFLMSAILDFRGFLTGGFASIMTFLGVYSHILWREMRAQHEPEWRAFRIPLALIFVMILFAGFFGWNWLWINEVLAFGIAFLLGFFLDQKGRFSLRGPSPN